MTVTSGTDLRRVADVVDALQDDTAIDIDGAQVVETTDDQIHAQLTVAIPRGTDLEVFVGDQEAGDENLDDRLDEDPVEDVGEGADDDQPDPEDEDVDAGDDGDEEYWCERCGYGPSSEAGVARHHGQQHDGSVSIVTSPPDDPLSGEAEVADDQDEADDLTPEHVHAELLAMVEDDGYDWVAAGHLADRLGSTGQKVGHRLRKLRERGDVEKREKNAAAAVWQPTDADVPEPPVANEDEDEDTEDAFISAANRTKGPDESDETGASTEDTTTEPESTSEAEARTGDLEEDAEADAPDQDAGAEDQNDDDAETFPRECHCGATLEDSLELAIHRTEAHGVPQSQFNNLEPGEFEAIVRDADSLQDIIDETGWSSTRTLRVMGIYGLGDVVGPDGIEFSDLGDYEFDGVATVSETASDPAGDDIDDPSMADRSEQRVANDGGAVAFTDYSASTGTTDTQCQNCGSHVDKQFAKVFEPEKEGAPRCCPNCENLVREGDGTIRPARNGGGA
ncbi:hypothetical protein C490_06002 [Natronobacterium gregoryi SP2]|uniref:Uncharacterized protein n=1 Tax=Natronobacterium gregoryi (strain ATCC 43098 / DSM 3393 / CCM 3738 / CIP 104747 / IAM 13177 / JCM 8860 / NBRC 102187 / NCIMB 2189 / SP2) TaxID=797304 RepID=L9Y9T5_NATGS|nr:hypothetical protein C490_06002 [Natronobacterium gregoryi SP2]